MQFGRAAGLGRWAGTCLLLGAIVAPARAEDEATMGVPAVVLKVEGEGNPRVRKRMGTEEIAGAGGQLLEGDRILTDDRSAVHLMLNDGTVLKIGFNSEFVLQKAEPKDKYISWAFKLLQGSIRALVEKIPEQETHLRVDTPSGTVGVRGTEFVLVHDPAEQGSHVYMLEGLVAYGPTACDRTKGCVDVSQGQASFVGGGKPMAAPAAYEVKDLFAADAKSIANGNARLSLFRDARRIQGTFPANSDPAALKKIVDDSREEMAEAQDRAIGRTKEQRLAMHVAMKDGTYYDILAAADAYAEAQGLFHHKTNGGAENMVAQVAAAKFRLGQAVVAGDAAGLFADKGGDLANRSFTMKKSVGFDQKDAAKALRERVEGSADDFRSTLEYSEALDASQVRDIEREGDPEDAKDAKDLHRGDRGDRAGHHNSEHPQRAKDPGTCHSAACRVARVAHQVKTAAEGSAAAYSRKGSDQGAGGGQRSSAPGKKATTAARGSLRTKYFQRTMPGNQCYETKKVCRMEPCSKNGKACKRGEVVQVCDQRQVAVRCPDR